MAVKYDIETDEILECIKKSYDDKESNCRQLGVVCRKKNKDSAMFLFTAEGEVLAQFPISIEILREKSQLERYLRRISTKKSKTSKANNLNIEDLRAGMKNIHLKAKVISIPRPNTVYTRSGLQSQVSNAIISDTTGTTRLSLWNDQISKITEGDTIEINNAEVANFRGELQLRLGRWNSIKILSEKLLFPE